MSRILPLACMAVLLVAPPTRAGLVIDTFDSGSAMLTVDEDSQISSVPRSGLGPGVLGGDRELKLTYTGGPSGSSASVITMPGLFNQSNNVLTSSESEITYDGPGDAGLGGVDLTAGGGIAFRFGVLAIDLDFVLTVIATDTSGAEGRLSRSGLSVGDARFPFGDPGYAGVDFSSIDAIVVAIDAPPSADLALDSFDIAPVPEPSTLGLGLGLAVALAGGLVGRARRRT